MTKCEVILLITGNIVPAKNISALAGVIYRRVQVIRFTVPKAGPVVYGWTRLVFMRLRSLTHPSFRWKHNYSKQSWPRLTKPIVAPISRISHLALCIRSYVYINITCYNHFWRTRRTRKEKINLSVAIGGMWSWLSDKDEWTIHRTKLHWHLVQHHHQHFQCCRCQWSWAPGFTWSIADSSMCTHKFTPKQTHTGLFQPGTGIKTNSPSLTSTVASTTAVKQSGNKHPLRAKEFVWLAYPDVRRKSVDEKAENSMVEMCIRNTLIAKAIKKATYVD